MGKARSDALAVMIDTFRPLQRRIDGQALETHEYLTSWLDGDATDVPAAPASHDAKEVGA